ncbi:MAG: ABC transporter permease [Mobilitalea sp.]
MKQQMDNSELETTGKSTSSKNDYGMFITGIAPVIGFVLVVIFFTITTKGNLLSVSNLQSLTNQVIVTALVSVGAVFVFGTGNLDMSLGGCVCISAVLGCMVAIPTGNLFLAFVVCIGSALIMGLLKGVLAAFVEVPFFIVTIVLGTVITAGVLVMLGKETTLYLNNALPEIPSLSFTQMTAVNIITLGLYFVLCLIVFNFTGLGREIKILGGNFFAARQSGIDTKRTKIFAFFVGSIGVGLAAFILLIRTRTVGSTTGGSIGIDVMVALVLGGMPISGGPRSKISAGLIGAATITVLNSGLTMMGLSTDVIQTCRGIIFLVVVLVTSLSYRTKLLPR